MKKIKCWVSYRDDGHLVFQNKADALEDSSNGRECEEKAYVRVKYFTQEELDALPEYD